ncbi:MAG: HAD family phosphatase [Chitinophagaceae bacterium]|nr:HAD family phosphatase [Chitinophagaceae bacterium]
MTKVKNIIFDLGGVFLNIDFAKTETAFRELGVDSFSEMFTQHHSNELFVQLETGAISPEMFYEIFREATGSNLSDESIKNAWNALLLDFRLPSLDWLEQIKDRYQIFLFSNTNQIHHDEFLEIYKRQTGRSNFDDFFKKAYYSQKIGMRKPSLEPFLYILKEQELKAEETLFIDDTIRNIMAAKEAGMQTIHLQWPQTVPDLGL